MLNFQIMSLIFELKCVKLLKKQLYMENNWTIKIAENLKESRKSQYARCARHYDDFSRSFDCDNHPPFVAIFSGPTHTKQFKI